MQTSPIRKSRWAVFALLCALQMLGAASAGAAPPAFVRIEVHYNFLTGLTNEWVSSGAFVDAGVIDVENVIHLDTPGVAKVVGPIVGGAGTISWKFHLRYGETTNPAIYTAAGEFHIIGGTGRYERMTGHGRVNGTIDFVTGDLVYVFTGWVELR